MICKKCHAQNADNAPFCTNCGASLAVEAPRVAPAQAPVSQPVQTDKRIPDEYKPISAWGYVGLNILYCIPIVGFVFLIIHTFNGSNLNRRSYARSFWCAALIAAVLSLLAIALILIIAAVTGVAVSELAYAY